MKKILLSAFSRYGDYPTNSTEQIAKIARTKVLGIYYVHTEVFDACIPRDNRGALLFEAALAVKARGIVCLGMASGKKGLCIETVAVNRISDMRYCPTLNGGYIDRDRPYGERLSLDLAPWNIDAFRTACTQCGIMTEQSDEPGGFCSNHLMYQLRSAQLQTSRYDRLPWIFIHVPCSPEAVPQPPDEFIRAGKTTMPLGDIIRGLDILLTGASI